LRNHYSLTGNRTLSTPFQLIVPRDIYEGMISQARSELPNECCGLLAGRVQEAGVRGQEAEVRSQRSEIRGQEADASRAVITAQRRYALVNSNASPREYLSDARSMFEAVRDMRRFGLEIVAIYHSHPTSAPVPSRTDLERNYSPEVMNLIISLQSDEPQIRAWWLEENGYREADWRLSE
jgi:[CysO sulfur-carrier protein]-S-L-cysteine hydrolase